MSPLFSFVVFFSCVVLVLGQADTGLRIDTARLASSFSIRDEYVTSYDCRSVSGIISGTPDFKKIATFDLVIKNLGSVAFASTIPRRPDPCTGVKNFQTIVQYRILTSGGSITAVPSNRRGICLEDTEPITSGTPTGTAAPNATYTCRSDTVSGLSVGWQTVIPKESGQLSIDLTPNLNSGYSGVNLTLELTFRASVFGNYSDVVGTINFFNPFDERCFPSPQYTVTKIPPIYEDPVGVHTLSTGWADTINSAAYQAQTFSFTNFPQTINFFCYPTPATQLVVRHNGIAAFVNEFQTSGTFALEQNDNDIGSTPFYIDNTIFPYWDSVFYINSSYSAIYYKDAANEFIVTWMGLGRINGGDDPVTFQMKLDTSANIYFSYKRLATTTGYTQGQTASVGVCAGPVRNPTGPGSGINTMQSAYVTNNCLRYSINSATLDTTSTVKFTRSAFTTRQLPGPAPVANITGTFVGQINSTYTFIGNYSTGSIVEYTWIWGDGSIPSSGPIASHTYTQVGNYFLQLRVYDGLQFSVPANISIYMGPIILNNGTKTGGDGGGDGTPGYIAIAVVLPILFVLLLIVLVAIFLFVFLRRHILASGGAWWEEDPIYLNLEE